MHAVVRLFAAGLCAAAAVSAVHAQSRSVQPSANPGPSAAARAATAAPRAAGLTSTFPAGISSGSGAAVSRDPIAAGTAPIAPFGAATATSLTGPMGSTGLPVAPELFPAVPGANGPGANVPGYNGPGSNVLGAGGGGAGNTVRGPGQRSGGAGGFSATDIARSFFFADGNKNGELTRAEAARLSIATMGFEEMDRNFDGIISRFEYEDSVR